MLLEYVQGMTNVERICQKNCINLAISQKIFTKLKKKNLNKLQKFHKLYCFILLCRTSNGGIRHKRRWQRNNSILQQIQVWLVCDYEGRISQATIRCTFITNDLYILYQ